MRETVRERYVLIVFLLFIAQGCKIIAPSNERTWAPDQAKLPVIDFQDDQVTIHNVRNCRYTAHDEYIVQHYDKQLKLGEIQSVDYLVVPFEDTPSIAHTMLSFGLEDGTNLISSVEIRKEEGEAYSAFKGFFNQYELMYVIGDERDIVNLSSNYYQSKVYLYPTVATPEQSQQLFLDIVNRANQLAKKPEFYNTLTNNCTTNIVRHVNQLAPNRVPYDLRILFPGNSDEYAYDLGLLNTSVPFEELKQRSKINHLAEKYQHDSDFSNKIRRR
ncbi:MAG: Lnb N-terminal periplasmic domain-containing protein [Pirellulales bacterium]